MQEISSEVINCEIQNRFITADDENSVVFNNNLCLVKHGVCEFARSTVIWDLNSVHKCPYYLITAVNAEIHKNDILIAYDEKLLFSVNDKIVIKSCDNIKILTTTEGLFISQDEKVLNFPKFNRDLTDLTKFTLSDTDLARYKMSNANKKLSLDICIGMINVLNTVKITQNEYFIFSIFIC